MKTVTFNNEIKIIYPDGFHVLSEEEMKGMNFREEGPVISLKDPERHVIVNVGMKQVPGFSALMLNQKDLAKKTEEYIAKANSGHNYRFGEFMEKNIGNDTGYGFSYSYEAQDTPMYSECFVLKKGKKVFYFYFYTRDELKDKNLMIWEEMLANISECLD